MKETSVYAVEVSYSQSCLNHRWRFIPKKLALILVELLYWDWNNSEIVVVNLVNLDVYQSNQSLGLPLNWFLIIVFQVFLGNWNAVVVLANFFKNSVGFSSSLPENVGNSWFNGGKGKVCWMGIWVYEGGWFAAGGCVAFLAIVFINAWMSICWFFVKVLVAASIFEYFAILYCYRRLQVVMGRDYETWR